MQLLLETHEPRTTPLGLAVSVVVHSVLALVLVTAAYRQTSDEHRQLLDEFATFLVPPDRVGQVAGNNSSNWNPGTAGEQRKTSEKGQGGTGTQGSAGPLSPTAGDTANSTQLKIDLPSLLGDSVLTEIQVDSTVKRFEWSSAPDYPIAMLQQNIEGSAFVIYVVDTTGVADTASFKVVDATHAAFGEAVREAMPKMRFRPAILGGVKVRQLVQQRFAFKIQRPDTILPLIVKPPQ
jgi:TonB family protein